MGGIFKLSAILLLTTTVTASTWRAYMDGCSRNGFHCNSENSTHYDIVFQCDDVYTGQDVEIWPFYLRSLKKITRLTIQNCDTVRIVMRCSNRPTQLRSLTLQNINNLILAKEYHGQNPREMHFENITMIENIPKYFFTQFSNYVDTLLCYRPQADLKSVYFKNVTIKHISSGAFYNLQNMDEIKFTYSRILSMQNHAFDVKTMESGRFVLKDTLFVGAEENSLHVLGFKILASDDDHAEIGSIDDDTICLLYDMY